MKKFFYFLLLVLVFSSSQVFAQVPNASFENWTGGEPDMWITNNIAGSATLVTQSNSANSGSSAIKGEVQNVSGVGIIGPEIYADDGTVTTGGFAISQRFNSLKGYYKFNTTSTDIVLAVVVMFDGATEVGAGGAALDAAGSYTLFQIPIYYDQGFSGTPTHCDIFITIADTAAGQLTAGSEMYLDDLELSLDFVSSADDEIAVSSFQLQQNYPNPFNPTTSIQYAIGSRQYVQLKVYDVLGNEVATLVNEDKPAGSYEVKFSAISGSAFGGDGTQLASGVYYYKLKVDSFVETKKMIFMK